MLEHEFKYYLDHQDELVDKYRDKFIVIVGNNVVGAYNSMKEAYDASIENYEEGTFLIQECQPGEESYTQTFHSRVIFS